MSDPNRLPIEPIEQQNLIYPVPVQGTIPQPYPEIPQQYVPPIEEAFSEQEKENLLKLERAILKNQQLKSTITQELQKVDAQIENVNICLEKVEKSSKVHQNLKRPANTKPYPNVIQKRAADTYFFFDGSKRPAINEDEKQVREVLDMFSNLKKHKKWTPREIKQLKDSIKKIATEKKTFALAEKYQSDNRVDSRKEFERELNIVKKLSPAELEASSSEFTDDDWDKVAGPNKKNKKRTGQECKQMYNLIVSKNIFKKKWTKQEDKDILRLAKKYNGSNWEKITEELNNPSLSPFLVFQRYQRSLNSNLIKSKWTKDEDKKLERAVLKYGEGNWQQVSNALQGRTGQQCLHRYTKTVNPNIKKGRWSLEEDKRLFLATQAYGQKQWKDIKDHVKGRTDVQCRERWFNILDPHMNIGDWSEKEITDFDNAIAELGIGNWSKIAEKVGTRTDNQCWRRWKRNNPEEYENYQLKITKRGNIGKMLVKKEENRSKLGEEDFFEVLGTEEKEKLIKKSKVKKRTRTNATKTHRYIAPRKIPEISPYLVYQIQRHYKLIGIQQRSPFFVSIPKTRFVDATISSFKSNQPFNVPPLQDPHALFQSPLCIYHNVQALPTVPPSEKAFFAFKRLIHMEEENDCSISDLEPPSKKRKISKLHFFQRRVANDDLIEHLDPKHLKSEKFKKLVTIFNSVFSRTVSEQMKVVALQNVSILANDKFAETLPQYPTKSSNVFKPKKVELQPVEMKEEEIPNSNHISNHQVVEEEVDGPDVVAIQYDNPNENINNL